MYFRLIQRVSNAKSVEESLMRQRQEEGRFVWSHEGRGAWAGAVGKAKG